MPLNRQCTMFRGMTFLQTDEDNIRKLMTGTASASRMLFAVPGLEAITLRKNISCFSYL